MIIYSKDGLIQRYDAKKFSYNGTFLGEAYLTMTITSEVPIAFQIGDYCEYRGERFELNNIPTSEKVSSSESYGEAFKYEDLKLKFLGYELSNCAFLDYVTSDNGVHYSGLSDFSFTGTVSNLAERIKANLDRIYTGGKAWAIIIDPTVGDTTETVSAQNITCFEALALANTIFDVNFIIRNRTITIGAAGIDAGTTFGYGKGNGIKSLIANVDNDSNIITRLRVFGNTTNIPYRWYNKQINPSTGLPYISESMYVPNLTLPDFLTNGGDAYIDSTSVFNIYSGGSAETSSFTYNFDGGESDSSPVANTLDAGDADDTVSYIDLYGIREGSVFFDGSDDNDDIYPTIIDMTAEQLIAAGITVTLEVGDDGNLDELHSVINPTDNGILPDDDTELDGTFTLVLKDLGFDLSEKDSDGEYVYASSDGDMTISMKSGNCAARDFIIIEDGITKETNSGVITYKLVCNRDQDDDIGMAFPNTSYLIAAGDKFVITNIQMPDVYVEAAMQKLLTAGTAYLNENNKPKYSYEPTIDNIYMAEHPLIGYSLKEGDTMTFEDLDLPVSKTIIISNLEIKEGESLIPQYSITLNNDVTVSTIQQIKNSVSETQLVVEENKKSILKYTNRSLADVKETAKALSAAFENYSEGISPAYVETLSLVAGDESGQFVFMNEYSSSATTIGYGFIWDNSTGILSSVTDKYLKHMTLGISDLTSSSYVRSYTDYRFWSLANTSFTIADDTLKYIYAKCGVATSTGTYIVSETPYIWDADASFYYFLIGVLNSQKDGSRSYSEVYGYTEILPGRITTEKIISSNGLNYFDLGSNKFNIGDDDNYINWNDKVANGLRIKGAIVQSQSGDTSVLPVYRGAYDSSTTYYKGDTVTYNGSTWQYVNVNSGQGHTPSDNEYWDVIAATGATGNGISSTATAYQLSTSGTTAPTGTWLSSIPSVPAGQYLWTRTIITYTNATTSTSYTVGMMGETGATGADGADGTNGVGIASTAVTYQSSSSGTTAPTGTWTSTIPSVSASQYLWTKTVWTYTDATTATGYSVGMMGATGATGSTGTGVSSITEEYYLSTSKTEQVGGSWVATPPSWVSGQYIWTRSKIIYSNPVSTVYTTPIVSSEWEAVDNLVIGGRNLLKNSSNFTSLNYWTNATIYTVDEKSCIGAEYYGTIEFSFIQTISALKQNTDYTLSFMVKTVGTDQEAFIGGGQYIRMSLSSTVGFTRVTWTFNTGAFDMTIVRFDANGAGDSVKSGIYLYDIKLEEGNKVTDWSPAPEDIQAQIDETITDIDVEYYLSTSSTVLSGGSWVTTAPVWVDGKFMWSRTKATQSDGTITYTPSEEGTCIAGATGTTGNYYEHRYAVNGSPTVAPSIVLTDVSPSGWSTTLPTQTLLQYTWITTAQKSYAGALISNWSTPQRLTGIHGDTGPAQSYKGNWLSTVVYYGNSLLVNVVYYTTNSTYYIARVDAGSIPAGTLPTDTTYWNSMGASFESVATGLLLAQSAYIENLIVSQLATSSNPYASRFANVGTGVGVFKNLEDQADIDQAIVAMGKDISIMQQSGERKPAIVVRDKQWKGAYSTTTIYYTDDRIYYGTSTYIFAYEWAESETPYAGILPTNDTYWNLVGTGNLGGGKYSELGSEGFFTNGSNIKGFAASSGITTNCSSVNLLQKRNTSSTGISAAVMGIDQTDSDDGPSKSYGGYFNRMYVGGIYKHLRVVSASTTLTNTDCIIHSYATSDITLTLPEPDNAMIGMEIYIRKLGSGNVTVASSSSSYPQWLSSSATSNIVDYDARTLFCWDGNYWVVNEMNN